MQPKVTDATSTLSCRDKEEDVIETEKQRRWWFATHPEFSSSLPGARGGELDEDDTEKVRPEDVDAYVDEALKYESGPVADLLKSVKRNFGTEGQAPEGFTGNRESSGYPDRNETRLTYNQGLKDGVQSALDPNRAPNPPLVLNPDYVSGFYQGVDEAQREYRSGWTEGYGAIHSGKAPPDLDPRDNSAYAQGVRAGATTALDEQEEWAQKWQDPIPFLSGSRHSRTLRKNLEDSGEPRQSPDEDGHHIVPWRHWRA